VDETIEAFIEGGRMSADYKHEIMWWSRSVLEQPCEAYAGLPPCPYARKAWEDKKVVLERVTRMDDILIDGYLADPESEMLYVYALVDSGGLSVDAFNAAINEFNDLRSGIWMMGAHHEAEDNDLMPDFEYECTEDYAIVLVQSLKHLVVASEKLRRVGYYENFSDADMAYVNNRKEHYDAWNEERHEGEEDSSIEANG